MLFAFLSVLVKSVLLLAQSLSECFSSDLHFFELLLCCRVLFKRCAIFEDIKHLHEFVRLFIVGNVIVFECSKVLYELVSQVFTLENEHQSLDLLLDGIFIDASVPSLFAREKFTIPFLHLLTVNTVCCFKY